MNNTTTLTKNQAYDIAKIAEPFLNSVLNPWDIDGDYPVKVSTIYKEIMNDPAGFRNYIFDIVSENALSFYEAGLANDILSALCDATGEEHF